MWFRRRPESQESQEALADANKNLRQVQGRASEVNNVTKALRDIRERNHFAEALEGIIAKRGPLDPQR